MKSRHLAKPLTDTGNSCIVCTRPPLASSASNPEMAGRATAWLVRVSIILETQQRELFEVLLRHSRYIVTRA